MSIFSIHCVTRIPLGTRGVAGVHGPLQMGDAAGPIRSYGALTIAERAERAFPLLRFPIGGDRLAQSRHLQIPTGTVGAMAHSCVRAPEPAPQVVAGSAVTTASAASPRLSRTRADSGAPSWNVRAS